MDDTVNKSGHRKVGGGAPYWGAGGPKLPPPVSPRKSDKSPARAPRDSAQDTGGLAPLLGSSRVNQRSKPIKSPYASSVKPTQPRDRPNVNVHPPEGTQAGKSHHRDAAVASLMTREKEKLAEEVVESRRLLRDMEEQLRVANTESLRLGAEVRKRDKTIAALGEARHSGPDGGRAARVTELETEVETYLSEIARLAKVLAGVHLDERKAGAKKVSFAAGTGTVPAASSGSSFEELSEEVRELRAQLALGPRLSKFGGDGRKRTEDATLEDDLHDAEERIRSLDLQLEEREQVARRLRAESERLSASGDELRREKEALQRDASRLREDREHFRRLAAMEAAAAAAAREEASVAKAEAARTKPVVSRLKQQLVTLVEQVDQMRAAGGASVRGGDTDMDGASIIAPSSIDATASRAFRRRAAAGGRLATMAEEGSEEASESGVPSRMSVESPGANEGGGGREEDEDSDVDEADEYLIADALDKSEASSSGYSSYGADDYDDDDETATRDDETHARSDSETTTSSKR